MEDLTEFGYIRAQEILKLLCVGQSTLWRWISNGKFPRPIKLGNKIIVWPIKDVRTWIETQNNIGKTKNECKFSQNSNVKRKTPRPSTGFGI